MKQELLKDKTDTISIVPYINNQPAIASSATVSILNPGGDTKVSAATATINGTTGEIYYSFSSALNTELGENFVARWTYVISGVTYYETTLFDVVLNRLSISVIDQDLLNEQSDLLERNESATGVVGSSGATSLVCVDLKRFENDYFNGGRVIAIDPATGLKQYRNVTDFVQSTGTLTIDTAWATNPTSSYTFILYKGFQKKIEQAFNEMMLDVRGRGFRPALILESSELKVPLTKKALSLICRDFMKEPEDKWQVLADEYANQYRDTFSRVIFQYDTDEDGLITGTEKDTDPGQTRLRR